MNLKQEKGAISIIVIVTMLFITGILTGVYMTSANRYKTQMQISDEMKNLYEKNVEQVADVYETFQNEKLYIYTKEQLIEFRDRVNSGISYQGKNVYLMNDIELNEGKYTQNLDGTINYTNNAEDWTTIGTQQSHFAGAFDGLGHTIKGMKLGNNQHMFNTVNNVRNVDVLSDDWDYYAGRSKVANIIDDGNGNVYALPKGFYYVGGTIANGIIISDNSADSYDGVTDKTTYAYTTSLVGNQFVWIPCEADDYKKTDWGASYQNAEWDRTTPQSELEQIEKYGGFYVARYEAGLASTISEFTEEQVYRSQKYNLSGIPQSKAGIIPWMLIDWTHAKSNSESMYNTEYVESNLITGTQWDVVLNTMINKTNLTSSDMTNNSSWGNYKNTEISYTGRKSTAYLYAAIWRLPPFGSSESGTTTSYSDNHGDLLTTGASSQAEKYHIFDIAGSLWEWTDEVSFYNGSTNGQYQVTRGGEYLDNFNNFSACYRAGGTVVSNSQIDIGFRPVLNIKVYKPTDIYIYTKQDLIDFRNSVNSGTTYEGKTVYLMNDIDVNEGKHTQNLDGSVTWANNSEDWVTIGNQFAGTFDGLGNTISGMKLASNQNMFNTVNKATNLNVTTDTWDYMEGKEKSAFIIDDGNGNVYALPRGFYYVGGTIANGIIISDDSADSYDGVTDKTAYSYTTSLVGNQFVWIPCTDAGYTKTNWGDSYKNADYDTTTLAEEKAKVMKYGGFYVARYEAGLASTIPEFTEEQEYNSQIYNVSGIPQSKAGVIPWIFIDWTHAKANAESMYNNNYVSSGLITGTQWDVILNTIIDKTSLTNSDIIDSNSWGNYANNSIPYTGRKATSYWNGANHILTLFGNIETFTTTMNSQNLLTTGASSDTEKYHIFDIAGNGWEFTNEISYYNGDTTGQYVVIRGGDFWWESYNQPACKRTVVPVTEVDFGETFRPVLYIK